MNKIILSAHDHGGTNAIYPLMDAFKAKGYEVFVYVNGCGKRRIKEAKDLFRHDIDVVLNNIKPNFIITGTSSNDFTEKFLWRAAERYDIPTMAILDHWCNYGIRFSKYGLKDIDRYNLDKAFDFLPSYICVMDDFAKTEMQSEGIPADRIYPLGNPHFETIKTRSKLANVGKIRSKFLGNNENKKIVTFASEPYEEDYGISPERKALSDIKKILDPYDGIILIVKLHLKESLSKYEKFTGSFFDEETDPIDLIMASDVIISMTSMFLIEAVLLGKKSLSYQPNEADKNKFILTRNYTLPFIDNSDKLNDALENLLNLEEIPYGFVVNFNATDNIVKFVEERLCQN